MDVKVKEFPNGDLEVLCPVCWKLCTSKIDPAGLTPYMVDACDHLVDYDEYFGTAEFREGREGARNDQNPGNGSKSCP